MHENENTSSLRSQKPCPNSPGDMRCMQVREDRKRGDRGDFFGYREDVKVGAMPKARSRKQARRPVSSLIPDQLDVF